MSETVVIFASDDYRVEAHGMETGQALTIISRCQHCERVLSRRVYTLTDIQPGNMRATMRRVIFDSRADAEKGHSHECVRN